MKTYRELLELSAKAAGVEYQRTPDGETIEYCGGGLAFSKGGSRWNPLADDGDEARLEAALLLSVNWYAGFVLVGPYVCGIKTGSAHAEYFDKHKGNKQAARRMAGVRAAAEIGGNMP